MFEPLRPRAQDTKRWLRLAFYPAEHDVLRDAYAAVFGRQPRPSELEAWCCCIIANFAEDALVRARLRQEQQVTPTEEQP